MARDPSLDITFNCLNVDRLGNFEGGVPKLSLIVYGGWLGIGITADPAVLSLSVDGDWLGSLLIAGTVILGPVYPYADAAFGPPRNNWVKWSDVGSISFEQNIKNISGERPLDWIGEVYEIKKLGSKVVVYGSGGISYLIPFENTYGLKTINRIGLLGSMAVTGTDEGHFFIDALGMLHLLTDKITKLDYSEYLSELVNPIILMDESRDLLYICDGILGFVYSIRDQSLGVGPNNLTGFIFVEGEMLICSSGPIEIPSFEICGDVIDVTSRKPKSITSVEFSTVSTGRFEAAIDYNTLDSMDFHTTPWVPVGPTGVAFVKAYGQEFRIRLRLLGIEKAYLDLYRVNGIIHGYVPIDTEYRL
jgi:hypothetical protein